jgi:hypothetical protein
MFAQTRVLSNAALVSAVVLATFAGSSLAMAQPATQPATPATKVTPAPAPAVATPSIMVLATTGKVQYKADSNANLADLKVGQRLEQGAEIFVGTSSIAQIKIGEGQVFTIDRLSRVLIKDAVKAIGDGKNTTTLQLPYGRIRFDVTSTKVANDVKIQTPDATLAVKGTHGILEKLPGQPTRAYGGELNAGIVNVMYNGGVNVDVKKNDKSTGDHPQAAEGADADTYVHTGDKHSEDETSRQSAGWTPSVSSDHEEDARTAAGRYLGQFFQAHIDPLGENPIKDNDYASIDFRQGGTVTLFDGNSPSGRTIGSGLSGFIGTPQGGAMVMTENGPAIVALDDSAGAGYTAGTMAMRQWNPGLNRWTLLGTLAPLTMNVPDTEYGGESSHTVPVPYILDGLGNLDGTVYASGINTATGMEPSQTTGNFGIFQLNAPSMRGGSYHAVQRMSFPMLSAGGGLTGANSRGTMFVAARYNLSTGAVPGMVLLEVDPRTNFIANAWSVADGSFSSGASHIDGNFQPSGVSFVDGQVVVTGSAGNRAATYTVRPNEATPFLPKITSATYGPIGTASHAMAGEGGFNATQSFPLSGPDRAVTPIPGVDPLWLGAAYSRSAANSPTFRRMMRDTILSMASDPNACALSAALQTRLPNAIADHYNQTSGVNAALNQFYASLPANHPCNCNAPRSFGHH